MKWNGQNSLKRQFMSHSVTVCNIYVTGVLSDTTMKLEFPLVMASSQQISIHATQDKSSSYFKCYRRFLSL